MLSLPIALIAIERLDLQQLVHEILSSMRAYEIQSCDPGALDFEQAQKADLLFLGSGSLQASLVRQLQERHPAPAIFIVAEAPDLPALETGVSVLQASDLHRLQERVQQARAVFRASGRSREHLQQVQQAENRMLAHLVRQPSITDALDHLCLELEDLRDGIRASVMLVHPGTSLLELDSSPSFSSRERAGLAGSPIRSSACPALQAAFVQQVIQVEDLLQDQELACVQQHRTPVSRSVYCAPIIGQQDQVLGVLSIESETPQVYPEWLQGAVNRLAAVAAVAVQRQQAQQQVLEHAQIFQGLFDHARDSIAIVQVEADGGFTYQQVNSIWLMQTGLKEQDVLGKTASSFFPPEAVRFRQGNDRICAATREAVQFEERLNLGSRTLHWLTQMVPVLGNSGQVDRILCSSRDIGLIKHAEQKLLKLNRLYTLLSEINKVMVRASTPEELFQQVCKVAVKDGGLRLAWIAEHDAVRQLLVTTASSDDRIFPLKSHPVDVSSSNPHPGFSSRALLEKRPIVVQDTTTSEITRPWASILQERRLLSGAAYPLRQNGEVIGCLNFFAEERNFFEADTHNLLQELAHDLSFALDHLHSASIRRQLEEDLAQREARLRSLVQSQSTFLLRTNLKGQFTFANAAFLQAFGFDEATFLKFNMEDLLLPEDQQRVVRVTQVCLAHPGQPQSVTVRLLSPSGELREIECEFVAVLGQGTVSEVQVMGVDRTEERKALQARLDAERRMVTSMDHFPGIFAIVDLQFRVLYVNRAGVLAMGEQDPGDLIGREVQHIAGNRWDTVPELLAMLQDCKATVTMQTRELHSRREGFTAQVTCVPVYGDQHTFNEILVVVSDLTEERRKDARMRLLSQVVEDSPSMVAITGPEGEVEYANHRYLSLHNAAAPGHLEATSQNPQAWQDMWMALQEGQVWQGEQHCLRENGEPCWERVTAFPIRDASGQVEHFVRLSEDITATKTLQAQLDYLAYHDPLTGLPNRQLLMDRLEQAIQHTRRNGHSLAVILLDLDQFKNINDTYGHAFGDQMLMQVAERLKLCLRPGDTISRQGGDEFVMLLSEMQHSQDAAAVASRILQSFKQPFVLWEQEFFITASMGISVHPTDGDTPEELIQHADTALNRTKQEGRNGYQFFEPQMNTLLHERMIIENGIRRGIEREEFYLLYQPRVDLKTGHIREVEALVRWNHPGLGRVSPIRFIPLAEETGAILPLGEAVLRMACQQAKKWLDQGVSLPISVNISARQFHKQALPELVAGLLQQHDLSPQLLRLEITESAMIADFQHTIEVLEALRAMGICVEIDDFGTGYSSLSYLHQLPITTLKIDRSFLMGMERQSNPLRDPRKLVEAILGLGRTLNLEVIAEGVETEHQRDFLLEHGCEYAQGYLFSPPVEPEKIMAMLGDQ
ncbi:EAL domain-containing protein [Deinococcus cellulosilyticus]|uniref:Uncharacterized protein n=1 Tax=Deinococcus cellulosilyticus (strain DSM 18568 / NBRC 106333 / KACC 11606 / 5516J-15) TaxID=1223518 RepID=A0A511MUU5_DEIC1|nr:EAL domain-containing protein [Deinococcus cellulosilyticus]GEM44369.1 hypothetical protein DC3_00040 [Deinococcus cellulosilyticus NBRC 106333 = KACC 11606]